SWRGLTSLILAGSCVGFSAYLWLLRNVRTSLVGTYAYVNPIVAVFLGWLILDETLPLRVIGAASIVLSSVALIVSAGGTQRAASGSGGRGPEVQVEIGCGGCRRPQHPPLLEHRGRELQTHGQPGPIRSARDAD